MGLFDLAKDLITLPISVTRDVVRTVTDAELPPVDESKTVINVEKILEDLSEIV